MSTPPYSGRQEGNSIPAASVPVSELYRAGYRQALNDFCINDLLDCLKSYSDPNFDAAWVGLRNEDVHALAALLIQSLNSNINGKLLADHLELMQSHGFDMSNCLVSLQLPPPATVLPASFPNVESPLFMYGDRLRRISDQQIADWGIVIGRFYGFAPRCCRWKWCYLIWFDPDSPISAGARADIAWEDDLEPLAV